MTVAKTIEVSGGILAGHDGSEHSSRAVEKAVELARALDASLTVVRAWTFTTAPTPATAEPGYVPPAKDFADAALAALDRDIASIRAENPDVTIMTTVVQGPASNRLIEASPHVDWIVVGRRGRGGFKGLRLGSVSDQIVRHAECTVVIAND